MKNKKVSNKKDYLESSLPKTRKEQFFDNISHRYRTLLLIGLILIVFFIPYLAALIYKDSAIV